MTTEFETYFQLAFLASALALVALELVPACQRRPAQRARRWTTNLGLFAIGSIATGVIVPVGLYAFALNQPPGLLSRPELPLLAQVALTFVLLDFWRYWEHRVFHRVSLLWRLHLVHHSDTHVDVTTGERHHPLDILLGTLTTLALISALGPPAVAVAVYLVAATAVTLYSHANLRLPAALDRRLALVIVTPSMHAVHHSAAQPQTDSNYGSVLAIWDRWFGTYTDASASPVRHYGLAYFHRPADATLGRALQQPFRYRHAVTHPPREDADPAPVAVVPAGARAALALADRDAIAGALIGCAVVIAVMWPTVATLMHTWLVSEPYQYAWLVVPMVVYLLGWHHRQSGVRLDPRPDFAGVGVVVAAAACWGAATLMNVDVGRQVALVLALQGVAMSTLGWRSYWRMFPTLALLFLMIPCGDLLQPALRTLTVHALDAFATVAGMPHRVDGYVIHIGAHRYVVVDECSGLAYVTLATFLGYCFGLLLYRSAWKVAGLALFGATLGVVCNVIRVDAIVLIDWLRDSQMDLTAHGTIQWVALLATLGVLFYVLDRLRPDPTHAAAASASSSPAPPAPRPFQRFGPVAAGLSVLLAAGSGAALATHESPLPHASRSASFPTRIGEWSLAAPVAASIDVEGGTQLTTLAYRRGDRQLDVIVIDALTSSAKLPEAALSPHDGNVWREHQRASEAACADATCVAVQHETWQRERSSQVRHAFYAYALGGFTTDSKLALRAAHGWRRLTASPGQPRLVGVLSDEPTPETGQAAAVLQQILAATR